jgi:uncharacterized RDD family membrane protein YckC
MPCMKCGSENDATNAFCVICGSPLASARSVENMARAYSRDGMLFRRWIATLVDLVPLCILATLPADLVAITMGIATAEEHVFNQDYFNTGMYAWAALVVVAYYIVLEGCYGCTLGKLILGIRVVNSGCNPPGFKGSFLRTITRLIEVNPILLGGLPAGIIASLSKKRQRLGDMWARTYVLRVTDIRLLRAVPVQSKAPITG